MNSVAVWDLPTRLFKWSLVMLVTLSWSTGGEGGTAFIVHVASGYAIGLLVLFRVAWGFVGGEYARFADFLRGPGAVLTHLSGLFGGKADRHVGHTPAGGWMIVTLLLWLAATVATGLLSRGEGYAGPLWPALGGEGLGEIHEFLVTLLPVLVGVHVLGVLLGGSAARQSLILAMVNGRKDREELPDGVADARPASRRALMAAAGTVALLGVAAFALTDFGGLNAPAKPGMEQEEGGERD